MKRLHLTILVIILSLAGIGLFLYKLIVLEFPLHPAAQSKIWNIEAKVEFTANGPATVKLFIPYKNKRFLIMNENFISRGFGILTRKTTSNRFAKWSIRQAKGKQTLYYQAVVRQLDQEDTPDKPSPPEPIFHAFEGAHREAAEAFISEIRAKSADTESFVSELMLRLAQPDTTKKLLNLSSTVLSDEDRLNLAIRLLFLADITSKAVHGVRLGDQRREASLVHWLEFYDKEKWWVFDPFTGDLALPENYLAWWRGPESMVSADGAQHVRVSVSVRRNQEEALLSALELGKIKQPFLVTFSLFSLPIQTQVVYRVLLLMPIGVFLLIILRNMVGLKTFGTFMPVLIALAFRETQLLWGVILFTLLTAIGMSIRLYLEHLKLLVIPRLAAVLIVVILLMLGISMLTHQLGLERGLSVALFPMVIMTMTIERAAIVWEELGPPETLKQAIGTLAASSLTYAVMSVSEIEHVMFVFPELLLVVLAGTILMGRYAGYRLTELKRFKAFVNDNHV